MNLLRRRLPTIATLLAVIAVAAGGLGYRYYLGGSLARLEGETVLAGLSENVLVERDSLGIASLEAHSRVDLARALGFVHAQERFFQMDLLRRRAAGELSALVGEAAVAQDRSARLHRMRARLASTLQGESPTSRRLVSAYTEGVNEGLVQLAQVPFEYLLLETQPEPWRSVDTMLVVAAMAFQLNDETARLDADRGLVHELLPPALADFLTPSGTAWDAPMSGTVYPTPEIPGPELLGEEALRSMSEQPPLARLGPASIAPPQNLLGSNNWAVSGRRSAHGGALLANDMHLGHAVPNIWFRVSMRYSEPDQPQGSRQLLGITLPGLPFLVAGSNGSIAWGFTNSNGDHSDLVLLEVDDFDNPKRYRGPEGLEDIAEHRETIVVKGGEDASLLVRETRFGPMLEPDGLGRHRAVRWNAHQPGGINTELGRLERAESVEEALRLAPTFGIPPQNLVVADSQGNIGWSIAGWIPERFGHDGRLPTLGADPSTGWLGKLPNELYPRIVNPDSGVIWTANARVVDGEELARIGDGGYALGARARQIRDALIAIERPDEDDMLAMQLDDRAIFLSTWRAWLIHRLTMMTEKSPNPELASLLEVVTSSWSGNASVDSPGYTLVRRSRATLSRLVLDSLTGPIRQADSGFHAARLRQTEGAVWRVLNEQPPHLVPRGYSSWDEAIGETLAAMVRESTEDGSSLASLRWGRENTSRVSHPLSGALGWLTKWTDMESIELPGDTDMPRVQGPAHGASERLVVSPGKEDRGIFHMPGGQSGHPLSPFYGAGHEDWVIGKKTPLLPGEAQYSLRLLPAPAHEKTPSSSVLGDPATERAR